MRVFKRRRKAVLGVLVSAAAAVFVLPATPAAAGTATTSNACANSVTANFSQIEVTTSGADGVDTVAAGGATTLSGLSQSASIPGAIFVAGYNLGLLQQGTNNIPANVQTKIEGTNTTQGTQTTNTVGGTPPNGSVSVTTVITDPDGTPGTGDESATDASFSVSYNDLSWTAGASGTINYRQESIGTAPPTSANNTLLINALIAGFLNVQFRCAPGTVTPPDPGVITLIDPAASFDITDIVPVEPKSVISIDDVTANEGDAGLTPFTFTVSLDSPQSQQVTVDFATSDGTANAPSDYASNTGTATFVPGDTSETVTVQVNGDTVNEDNETFNVDLSNPTGNVVTPIVDNQGHGTISNDDPPPAISIDDQTVTEGQAANFTASLNHASDQQVTVDFATSDGTANAPGDYTSASGTVTFAPNDISEPVTVQTIDDALGENTETFNVDLSNPTGGRGATIADNQGVGTILDNDVTDAAMNVVVSGPTRSAADGKTVKAVVSNVGTSTFQVCDTDISWNIMVNGAPTTGTVAALNPGCSNLAPGGVARFRFRWTYGFGEVTPGAIVDYTATVTIPGDAVPGNNSDTETRTAK